MIADRLAPVISNVMSDYRGWSGTADAFVLMVYAIQLYADFSAGIDITRGIGEVMGIDLAENFRRPYFSRSLSEYWRRWHITLGAWMKNYIFFPIAVSGKSVRLRKMIRSTGFGKTEFGKHVSNTLSGCIATLIVFLIVGMWHGASWRFVFFGFYNGILIALSMLMEPVFINVKKAFGIMEGSYLFRAFQYIRTLLLVLIGYVFDIAPSLREGFDMIGRMITGEDLLAFTDNEWIRVYGEEISVKQAVFNYQIIILSCMVLFFVSLCQERTGCILREKFGRMHFGIQWIGIVLLTLFILSFGAYGPGYDIRGFV